MSNIRPSTRIFLLSITSNIITLFIYIILKSIISTCPIFLKENLIILIGTSTAMIILASLLKLYSKPLDIIKEKIETNIVLSELEKRKINKIQFGLFILYPIFFTILYTISFIILASFLDITNDFFTDIGAWNHYFFSFLLGLASTIIQIYLFNDTLNKLKNQAGITKLYKQDKKLTLQGKLTFIIITLTILTGITISYTWEESMSEERLRLRQHITGEVKDQLNSHLEKTYQVTLSDDEFDSIMMEYQNIPVNKKHILRDISIKSMIIIIITALFAFIIIWIFSKDLEFQFNLLKKRIYKMVSKDIKVHQNLIVTSVDEVGQVVSDFNQLIDYHKNIAEEFRKLNELKDEFLANTSHELKTPLNGIVGIAESLSDGIAGKLNRNAISNLKVIIAVGKRLSKLIDDVLDFSKIKRGEITLHRKSVNINNIIASIISMFRYLIKGKDIKIINELKPYLPMVNTDENRFQQIMYNIIGNAVKFTNHGYIKIYSNIITINDKKMLKIFIEDTGIGIPQEKIDDIFNSYEQISEDISKTYGGTGLGLYIVKKLVDLNEGEIHVESELSKGSTFILTLPIADREDCINKTNLIFTDQDDFEYYALDLYKSKKNKLHRLNKNDIIDVLVVDDEPVNQQIIYSHLGFEGYRIRKAFDGTEALICLDEAKPDIVLLDVMMPRMSGFELCRKIRDRYTTNELPILMLTVRNRENDIINGFVSGANDYITKPFSKKELLARINVHVKLSRMTQAYKISEKEVRKLNEELEQKVKERTREMEEAYKELESFSYRVSHDLKNPISIIEQSLDVMYRSNSDIIDDRLAIFLNFIDKNTKKMNAIIENLLILSKVAATKIKHEKVNLSYMMEQLINDIRLTNPGKNIEFVSQPDIHATVDKELIRIALGNLVDNAFKYSSKESQIIIEFGIKQIEGQKVYFIKDNGTGFDMNNYNLLFQPFQRLHPTKDFSGSGIGLSTVKSIIEKHNGKIWAESKSGEGAVFYFTLGSL